MKVFIEDEKCIGCGSCIATTNGKIFDYNDEGKAYLKTNNFIETEDEKKVKASIEYCPTNAIKEIDKEETNDEK